MSNVQSIQSTLSEMTLAQMVERYNQLRPEAQVTKFRDRASAERRLGALLADLAESQEPEETIGGIEPQEQVIFQAAPDSVECTIAQDAAEYGVVIIPDAIAPELSGKAGREPKARKERVARPLTLDYPVHSGGVKPPKPTSRRGIMLALMERADGASLEEIMSVCRWTKGQAVQAVRLLHHEHGFGVHTDAAGRFAAVRPQLATLEGGLGALAGYGSPTR